MAGAPRATLGLGRVPIDLPEPLSLLFDRSKLRLREERGRQGHSESKQAGIQTPACLTPVLRRERCTVLQRQRV